MSCRKSRIGRQRHYWNNPVPGSSLTSRSFNSGHGEALDLTELSNRVEAQKGSLKRRRAYQEGEKLTFEEFVLALKGELPSDYDLTESVERIFQSTRPLFPEMTRDDILNYI